MPRTSEVAALSKLVRETESGLGVVGIIGPGGVGKSYLLDEVFRREKPADLGFMHLSVDASNPQTRGDFFGLIDGQLAARSLPPPARPDYDYFPQVRSVASLHRDMVEKARDELERGTGGLSIRIFRVCGVRRIRQMDHRRRWSSAPPTPSIKEEPP